MAIEPTQDPPQRSNPVNRMRWATQRVSAPKASLKRLSILRRHNNRNSTASAEKGKSDGGDGVDQLNSIEEEPPVETTVGRTIYFNSPLPDSARGDDGRPSQHFKRNKIRTAKYTPLSFVPKNLWFQFHSIANIYFLFVIILSGFSIFGVQNPGLAAVPLIVIILVTAIKDGIEDWRRTVLDNELNNAPIHRLVNWENVNVSEEKVSAWRKFKKANTRVILAFWRWWKNRQDKAALKKEKGKAYVKEIEDKAQDEDDRRISIFSARFDADVEMTPVPSPTPDHQQQRKVTSKEYARGSSDVKDVEEASVGSQTLQVPDPTTDKAPIPKRFYGSIIDPTREASEKARFRRDFWKDVRVGDFVRLYNEEQIPADIIVLSTSDADGACYIETKNLDGETNLKVRHALHASRKVKRARDCERTDFWIESEPPHANLYAYSGVLRWHQKNAARSSEPSSEMAESIGINNLLLRGCTLRNTDWVIGVVAFAGDETKIMLNSGITPSKRAQISKELNWNVIYNFIILFIMCLVAGLVEGSTWGRGDESLNFFEFGSIGGTAGLNGFITFWAAVILFQNLVPISLYISLEIIRTAQAYFIYSDTWMYYEPIDYPCTPKSWNISDDLGQIEYIFSDKTGTLTQNVMEFKKCTINSVPYGEAYTEALAGLQKRQGINVEEEGARARTQIAKDRVRMLEDLRKLHNNPYLSDDALTFVAPDFVADLTGAAGEEQKLANERFMLALALCHTVITERTPGDPPKIEFKAQSPDEAALVATAKDVGFTVLGNTNDGLLLNVLGEEREYTILNTLEFNSTRKRMSAILRMPDGKIVLFCKGADSIIYSRLKRGEQPELRKNTAEHLEMFAREGLRTLCIAQRELSEDEYQKWNIDHDLAAASVTDREDKLEEVADRIERELTLLGGTAIEDRLQDGVPDSIALLAQAGIKLWVLTGDKVETAINIGFSCNLLDNDMDLIILKPEEDTVDAAEAELDKYLLNFGKTGSDEELKLARKNHEPPAPTHALVIDGDTLKLVLDETIKQKFLLLCKECRSVLCCRVSPAQKAAVVRLVKNSLNVMTLSIGDGANDVAMIQEAHVGVGIAGEEGRQAVMSSDYAIGQFKFLSRLLLVHGRWSYRRLAETCLQFFTKNIVWVFPLFWFQIFTNFDCTYVYDYSYILLFNLAFTSLPIIFLGILDQDVDDKVSLAVPQLYRRGIERKEWTQLKFWLYMLDGVYMSVVIFWFTYGIFAPATFVTSSGQNVNDYKRIGVYLVNPAVFVVNAYILLNTYRWDWFITLITGISIGLIYLWTGAYTSFTAGFFFYGAAAQVYGALSFWALNLFIIILALLPRFVVKSIQKMYFPYDVDIIREQVKQGKFDYLKGIDPLMVAHETADDATSSESSHKGNEHPKRGISTAMSEDKRPIYPPSVAQTTTTHNPRSHNGSDGTDYTGHRSSLDRAFPPITSPTSNHMSTPTIEEPSNPLEPPTRPSMDRPRPSFDRMRSSMDRTRPSFEASRDFTSAAYLARIEGSAHPETKQHPLSNEHRN